MKTIRIKKLQLKEKLEENLKLHDDVYNEALDAYWDEVSRDLNHWVKSAKREIKERDITHGGIRININIDAPENHSRAYENAIQQLEYEVNDIVELDQREFNSYVLNQWDWVDSFVMSNSKYSSATSMSAFTGQV